jgi:hypothetical protein
LINARYLVNRAEIYYIMANYPLAKKDLDSALSFCDPKKATYETLESFKKNRRDIRDTLRKVDAKLQGISCLDMPKDEELLKEEEEKAQLEQAE